LRLTGFYNSRTKFFIKKIEVFLFFMQDVLAGDMDYKMESQLVLSYNLQFKFQLPARYFY